MLNVMNSNAKELEIQYNKGEVGVRIIRLLGNDGAKSNAYSFEVTDESQAKGYAKTHPLDTHDPHIDIQDYPDVLYTGTVKVRYRKSSQHPDGIDAYLSDFMSNHDIPLGDPIIAKSLGMLEQLFHGKTFTDYSKKYEKDYQNA